MAPGQKPQGKVKIGWSADFAYAIGLIASDGCLSSDRRHIVFTSKEIEQIDNFQKCLKISCRVGRKARAKEAEKKYFVVQISDVRFYEFLLAIGLHPAKSKTLRKIDVPEEWLFDFVRGVFDGDGSTYSYFDPRWKSSFMYYIGFASASPAFLDWMRSEIFGEIGIIGHITSSRKSSCLQLKYAKKEALILIRRLYRDGGAHLPRKRLKIKLMLAIVGPSIEG
jgi:hypothetical protein